MTTNDLQVLPLHKYPEYLKKCCMMINDEWPRTETARMMSLEASCDTLPTSLILINGDKQLLGHCKLSRIPRVPDGCFLETVVIKKSQRGKKLGTYLMQYVENYCKNHLNLHKILLSTKGQEDFYSKLGYEICEPVSIYGDFIKPSKQSAQETATKLPTITNISNSTRPTPPPPPMPKNHFVANIPKKTFMFKKLM